MTKEQILTRLKAAQTEEEWDYICDEVKKHTKTLPSDERSGSYPTWWFKDVIMAGLKPPRN